jgi:molybdenum cofactor cytidylyltransferase
VIERDMSTLFHKKPPRWGLRGDPYLWEEMQASFEGVPIPKSKRLFEQNIADAFEKLAGRSIELEGVFVVDRFKHGGMSSGGIDPTFWLEKAVPFLWEQVGG